jgi:hypothetical protein
MCDDVARKSAACTFGPAVRNHTLGLRVLIGSKLNET